MGANAPDPKSLRSGGGAGDENKARRRCNSLAEHFTQLGPAQEGEESYFVSSGVWRIIMARSSFLY
jgi:hypothetical protein